MSAIPPRSPAERIDLIIDLLCRATAARIAGGALAGPLIMLIWTRLRRLGTRFHRLAARIAAGTPPAPARRRAVPRPAPPRPPHCLPRGFAWLPRLVPDAASGGSQLRYLLTEPDMAALIAADPRVGRLLRPLCRMLGVTPTPALTLPAARHLPPAPARPAPAAPAAHPTRAAPPTPAPPPRRAKSRPPAHPAACGPPHAPAARPP